MGWEEGTLGAGGCTGVAGVVGRSVAEGLPLAGCAGSHPVLQWSVCKTPTLTALRVLVL